MTPLYICFLNFNFLMTKFSWIKGPISVLLLVLCLPVLLYTVRFVYSLPIWLSHSVPLYFIIRYCFKCDIIYGIMGSTVSL